MMDSRLKPNTTSASDHVRFSSGPRCRWQCIAADTTGRASAAPSLLVQISPSRPHTLRPTLPTPWRKAVNEVCPLTNVGKPHAPPRPHLGYSARLPIDPPQVP